MLQIDACSERRGILFPGGRRRRTVNDRGRNTGNTDAVGPVGPGGPGWARVGQGGPVRLPVSIDRKSIGAELRNRLGRGLLQKL